MGGRIDAIGLSVVMPEGPRRIPGRLSVAPAPPAVRKLSGSYISSASAFRILAGACLSSRRNVRRTRSATARRCRYSCERRTGVSAPVRKRPRIRQRPSLSARRQCRRHSLESHQLWPLALVSRAYSEILGTRPSVRLRRWQAVPSQGSPCLKIATRRPF